MKIALDYDDTYTLCPNLWDDFIHLCLRQDFDIRIVTHRHEKFDRIAGLYYDIPVIYTNGVAKAWWCHHYEDFDPDVWVDDSPQSILQNSTMSKEALSIWRAERD